MSRWIVTLSVAVIEPFVQLIASVLTPTCNCWVDGGLYGEPFRVHEHVTEAGEAVPPSV